MRPSTTFALSTERGNQLRSVALHKRISVAELVAGWIDRELRESDLPTDHAVIEITVERDGDDVTLNVELYGVHVLNMTPAQAESVAASILNVLDNTRNAELNADTFWLEFSKRGTGIVMAHESFTKSMPFYEARQIAEELREAAAEYGVTKAQ